MRLKTKEITADVPLEDGGTITVKKVSQEIYFATIHPVNAIIFTEKDKGLTAEEQKALFTERVTALMEAGDIGPLTKIQDSLCYLMVIAWDGVEDEDGSPLECTAENIELARRLNPEFCCDLVTAGLSAIEAKEAELAKN
jgi:hypothetical protein